MAVISVPGDYASLAAYQALTLGLHVLLFSDNVPLEKEIELKDYARGDGVCSSWDLAPAQRCSAASASASPTSCGPAGRRGRGRRHRRAGGHVAARPLGRGRQPGDRCRRPGPVRGRSGADGARRRSGRCATTRAPTSSCSCPSRPRRTSPREVLAAAGGHPGGRRAHRAGPRLRRALAAPCSPTRWRAAWWPR